MKTLKIFTIAALASLALPQAIAAQETAPETVQVGITEYPISGEGTETSPYVLENRNHMRNMKSLLKKDETVYFILGNDIDMQGIAWEPLNNADPYNFRIVFDGKNHAIKNLYCYNKSYASFFGVLYGECRNVRFINPRIYSEKSGLSHIGVVGGYVGTDQKPGTVEHVSIEGGYIYAYWTDAIQVGGLAGCSKGATINNCYVDVTVHTHHNNKNTAVGGIVGEPQNPLSNITNCFVKGEIKQTNNIDQRTGGVAGNSWGAVKVDKCIAWLSNITGKFTSNAISANGVGEGVTNYCNAATTYTLTTDASSGCSDPNKPNYSSSVHGIETSDPIAAAKALGWDQTVWDLSGNEPKLLWPEMPLNPVEKTTTLLDNSGWTQHTIDNGLIYYTFNGYDNVTNAYQIVNVVELDLTNDAYSLVLPCSTSGITCSEALRTTPNAVAAVNAAYEHDAVYLKSDNRKYADVSISSSDQRYWKHEAAIYWSTLSDLGMEFPAKDNADPLFIYKNDKHDNLVASAPMLIYDGDPLGLTYVDPSLTWDDFKNLENEDYRRHQGVRHPRTAIAITEDRDLLLITVDGRWSGKAEGMNARELTEFLVHYFNPLYALNMDGGGSTTMCVKGYGDASTNIVNYPTDNEIFDHTGERAVNSHFVITKK